ncbi:MAG TPA: gliding motility-associated C-terminal domain-containing protein, partial [Cytophagaceae bacterium]|nr:gliding motility-associated C-terminal domain-containing protein [Cytophagaceae bacterium]
DGNIDPSFGTNGELIIPNVKLSCSDIAPITAGVGALYVAGKVSSNNNLLVAKIIYHTQSYNILGKDIASISSQSDYYVQPIKAGYTYQWSANNTNVFTKNSISGDTLTVFFTNDTSSVTLTCSIIDVNGALVKTLTKKITINPEPTLAQSLTPTLCAASQTNCQTSYINSFSIVNTKVGSTNTGCSPTGYFDFTSSSHYDTLYIGSSYQATIEYGVASGPTAYFGVWIDFNNDGQINDTREFVGSSSSTTGTTNVNNILIPTDVEQGPKRLRARIRLSAPFTVQDFCATNDETAETEDYLIVLNKYNGVKTPNFITPNNDGKNDLFIVHGADGNTDNNLKVFNKIGDLVFEANNYDNTWAGKDQNGNALKSGTYYYVFSQTVSDKKKDDVVRGFLEIRY